MAMIMSASRSITATEFEASCLDLLDQISAGRIKELTTTERGKPVAVVTAPPPERGAIEVLFGMMKGSVIAPPDFDFTAPAFEGVMEAAMDDPPDSGI
jgi:antitoxin (DNA-binding transcriptional repressor) of toxin-antitoxin stability system